MQKVLRVIEAKSKNRTLFNLEDLLLFFGEDGTEVPSYQLYLVVAWLKKANLLIQHGRRGYTVVSGHDLTTQAEQHWSKLFQI